MSLHAIAISHMIYCLSQQTREMIYKCLNRFFYDATSLLPQHIVACVIQCVLKGVDIYKE